MITPVPDQEVLCTQCGGELHPDEGQIFLTCPYCSSTVYLDKSRVVFHWYLASTLNEDQARASLARWMAGNETVKDLDKKAQITGISFQYFPVWYFKLQQPNGADVILLEPAAAISVTEIRNLNLPAGDLRKYDDSLQDQAITPSVPLQAAVDWLAGRQFSQQQIQEQALVHVPVFMCKYTFRGNSFTALVEAGTGRVIANIYPAKSEAPYHLAGILTAVVFLVLACIPLVGAMTNKSAGAMTGLTFCFGIGVLVTPLLFALAIWVAAKI